jgi:hypothetical protein
LLTDKYLDVELLKKSKKNSNFGFNELRWVLSSYGLLASFYNSIDHQKRCESTYVKYIQITEQLYSRDSIEASNAYFLVGVYYSE